MRIALHALLVLMALIGGSVTQATEFDDQRVFTRAEDRERLDRAREGVSIESGGTGQQRRTVVSEPPKIPPVRLRGFIQRSDGPPAVWVNDESTLGGDRVGGRLQVESGRIDGQTVLIRLPDGRYIRLKPGQRYDPDSGRVVDALRQ